MKLILMMVWVLIGESNAYTSDTERAVLAVEHSQGLRLELAGVVICDPSGSKVHDMTRFNELADKASVEDVVQLLGPGYVDPNSSTGGITWFFSDGSRVTTVLWPENLQTPVKKLKGTR